MDNQQPKIGDNDIAWLAGFIDGEGCFDFPEDHVKQLKQPRWRPRVRIANTDQPTLIDVVNILRGMGVGHFVEHRVPKVTRWSPSWCISIWGLKRVERFLPMVIPHLRTRKRHAELMVEWCRLRLAQEHRDLYTPEMEAIISTIKDRAKSVQRLHVVRGEKTLVV